MTVARRKCQEHPYPVDLLWSSHVIRLTAPGPQESHRWGEGHTSICLVWADSEKVCLGRSAWSLHRHQNGEGSWCRGDHTEPRTMRSVVFGISSCHPASGPSQLGCKNNMLGSNQKRVPRPLLLSLHAEVNFLLWFMCLSCVCTDFWMVSEMSHIAQGMCTNVFRTFLLCNSESSSRWSTWKLRFDRRCTKRSFWGDFWVSGY